ncbi:Crp/Fnr family transcriptional regulator [Rhizobiaceae bacterium n13]|uniref:Crp/Fnr family transcriptional regulator n=1 Tax=Ferirhizobium litorale TaxID=2927786 RepID=UPI0024B28F5F|nr:Crp/Fnr family transcriptional regulator [Fererhizobium litorale]MDI7865114.1 Crp/Fnr family transcriptional regulator [Fererhizobium litorale]
MTVFGRNEEAGQAVSNAFISKLQAFEALREDDLEWLMSMIGRVKVVGADQDLIRQGDNPEAVHVILEGFAARYKLTSRGRRQIFGYLIPGDFCDLHVALLKTMDHSIATLSRCRVATLSPETIIEITDRRPALSRALWMTCLVDEATLREWLLNLGQRSAKERIAHLFCELHVRMKAVDLTTDGYFELPLTQQELSDTMGLSVVHVNRSLKELRDAGLVSMSNEQIAIPNVERLKQFSGFDPTYLHLRAVNSL